MLPANVAKRKKESRSKTLIKKISPTRYTHRGLDLFL